MQLCVTIRVCPSDTLCPNDTVCICIISLSFMPIGSFGYAALGNDHTSNYAETLYMAVGPTRALLPCMLASKTAATKIEKVIPVASHHDGFTVACPVGAPQSFPRILVRDNPISATKRAAVISEVRANIIRGQVEAIRADKAAYLASLGY